jgi:hypothetical protein
MPEYVVHLVETRKFEVRVEAATAEKAKSLAVMTAEESESEDVEEEELIEYWPKLVERRFDVTEVNESS